MLAILMGRSRENLVIDQCLNQTLCVGYFLSLFSVHLVLEIDFGYIW